MFPRQEQLITQSKRCPWASPTWSSHQSRSSQSSSRGFSFGSASSVSTASRSSWCSPASCSPSSRGTRSPSRRPPDTRRTSLILRSSSLLPQYWRATQPSYWGQTWWLIRFQLHCWHILVFCLLTKLYLMINFTKTGSSVRRTCSACRPRGSWL